MTEQDVSGWTITPDDGPVDGKTDDCTGAPYDWPDLQTLDHASQFLDRPDETVALVVKRVDGQASESVEALRGALAPCAPQSGAVPNGAMITLVGDDSFAYQSRSSDDLGDFTFSNMLVSCEDLILEVSLLSYSSELDQAGLEELVSPSIERLTEAGGC